MNADSPSRSARFLNVLGTLLRDHEALKDYLTCVALVGTGVWALYSYTSLNQKQRAEAELALLRQDPVANVDLAIADVRIAGKSDPAMMVIATIENAGRRVTTFTLGDVAPLTVMRLGSDSAGNLVAESASKLPVLAIAPDGQSVVQPAKTSLLPGEKVLLHFLQPSVSPGLYLVQFSVPVATSKTQQSDWHWTARRLYVVCQSGSRFGPLVPIQSPRDTACAARLGS